MLEMYTTFQRLDGQPNSIDLNLEDASTKKWNVQGNALHLKASNFECTANVFHSEDQSKMYERQTDVSNPRWSCFADRSNFAFHRERFLFLNAIS
jgi:hypothetical protein